MAIDPRELRNRDGAFCHWRHRDYDKRCNREAVWPDCERF